MGGCHTRSTNTNTLVLLTTKVISSSYSIYLNITLSAMWPICFNESLIEINFTLSLNATLREDAPHAACRRRSRPGGARVCRDKAHPSEPGP